MNTGDMRVVLNPDSLRVLAARRNRTLEEIARGARVHPNHFSKLMSGECSPSAKTRRALLATLRVSFEDLFIIVVQEREAVA